MVIIDAGHGGVDSGALGEKIVEKDYDLKISQYMYERLKQLNIPVAMTRNADVTLTPAQRIRRIKELGDVSGNVLISNHLNASTNQDADGAEAIYALRSTDVLPNIILQELAKTGQNIRSAYQKRLPGNASQDFYYIMRETSNLEPIIVEYGFITSNKDDVVQIITNWEAMAEAVVRALTTYLNVSYQPLLGKIYIVQSGDNLYEIANQNGISVNDILQANNLFSSNLQIGQSLIIPDIDQINTLSSTYTVVMGDSLYNIANKFNVTVNEIKELNGLSSNLLQIGQKLLIPDQN